MIIKLIFYKREIISLLRDNVDEVFIRNTLSYFLSYAIEDVTEDEITILNSYMNYELTLNKLNEVFNYE